MITLSFISTVRVNDPVSLVLVPENSNQLNNLDIGFVSVFIALTDTYSS